MTRRDFIGAASAFTLASGCVTGGGCKSKRVQAAMQALIDKKLYGGLACGANTVSPLYAGLRTLDPAGGPVTAQSMFDLASVGKTHTAALCAILYAQGKLDPDAPFTKYMPQHVLAKENCKITVRDLATHSGGFDNSKPYATPDVKKMFDAFYAKRPKWGRGERFEYACSNFAYLGFIVENITGMELGTAARKLLWEPLGMNHTTWDTIVGNPNAVQYAECTYRWCPSDPMRKIGERNDICAHWAPRGVGNGANFSTCGDMLLFVEDILYRKHFPKAYYDLLLTPCFEKKDIRRSFGWDMKSPNSESRVYMDRPFSDRAIFHTGWTGNMVMVDPERDFAGVVLGSRQGDWDASVDARIDLLIAMAK